MNWVTSRDRYVDGVGAEAWYTLSTVAGVAQQ